MRNKTSNRPDAGETVALIAPTENMQEVARTRTDAAGHYSIETSGTGMYLVRVQHQKVAYFAPLPSGTTHADVEVYDVAPNVSGVTTEADMRRVETDQQGLYVVENYFVSNESSPRRTQLSPKSYEVYLPGAAQLEGSGAMGPEGIPVESSLVAGKDKGHYAFAFPLRPGRTRFQVSYHLPYTGSYSFQSRVSLPTKNLAVALPKSMAFNAESEGSFQSINGDDPGTQIFVARDVQPSQTVAFTVSGNGALTRDAGQSNQTPGASQAATAPEDQPGAASGGPGLESSIATPNPLNQYKWWIMGGVVLILVMAAVFLLRSRSGSAAAGSIETARTPARPGAATQNIPLDALKQELFALETERLEGKLSETEYRKQKAAFEIVLKRALIGISPPSAKKNSKRADTVIS